MRMRIDELAAESGVSSRNIRAYQARGLLPPPELEGRTGYYDEEHLARLKLIDELQERGFSLAGIKHTLDAWSRGGDLSHLLGLHNVILAPFGEEESAVETAEALFERFPEAAEDLELVGRAVDLELIVPRDDGTFEVPSPMVLEAGEVLVQFGVPLATLFDLVEAIREDVADIAQRFVGIVADEVVLPLAEEETPAERGDEALRTVRTLRPLALEVVRPFLARELERAIEEAVRSIGARLGDD